MKRKLSLLGCALLLASMVTNLFAQNTTSPYTGVAVGDIVSGNDYYLYNVESGLWLQNNDRKANDWHTRGQLGTRGIDFQLNSDGNGGYKLNAKFGRGSVNRDDYYLDNNDDHIWVIEAKSGSVSNAVTIKSGSKYLTADKYTAGKPSNNFYNVGEPNTEQWYLNNPENSNNGTWQIVTKEERLAKMAAATETNPIDATWLIKSPDFANNDKRYDNWTRQGGWARGGDANGDWGRGSMIMESWNSGSDVEISQTVAVPNGKYALQLQGYYRDGMAGDNTDYNDRGCTDEQTIEYRHDAGTEVIRAKFYANASEADLRSIIDETHTTAKTGPDCWNFTRLSRYYFPNDMQTAQRAMNLEKAYVNDPIEVTVTDGNLKIGVKKTGSSPYDWVIIDNFKLTYLGPVVDLGPYLDGLNQAIAAAEAYSGQTTDVLANNLSNALSDANSKKTSTDIDEISAATSALNSALAAAQAVDVSVLRPTVAYVKAKGVDVSAQEDFLANGTTNDVANQQNAAILALKFLMADKSTQPTIFTMISESVVGTDDNNRGTVVTDHADGFYAYNVGTGRWFCGGDDWGAHAAVGFPGIKFTTPEDNYNNGHYNGVVTWLFNGNWGNGGKLGNNGYCDTGGNAWKFWKKDPAQGIYTWSNNGNDQGVNESNGFGTKDLVGFSPSTYMRVDVHQSGDDNPYNQWIFVTEAQRDEMAANANPSATNPVDLTYKIKMPGFNQRERKEGTNQGNEEFDWTCNHANYRYNANDNGSRHLILGRGDNHADFVCDVYGGDWNDAFSLTQTVTGLKPGNYRVKVQGYNNGGDDANKACLVANGKTATLKERNSVDALPWTNGLPENTFDNPEYFQVGLYWNEVECTVGSNGELTLGVESPSITGGHVVIFDNFRLEYLGSNGINTMSIMGDFTGGWDFTDDKHMTMDENDPNIWTLTINNFKVDKDYYEYKATANDTWGVYEKPAEGSNPANQNWQFGTTMYPHGYYKLEFTMNTETHELTLVPTRNTLVTIDEGVDYVAQDVNDAEITLNRTIAANDTWNTFCVPFDISNADLKAQFGDDVAVAEYTDEANGENSTINFNTMATPAVTANVPVLLKSKSTATSFVFGGDIKTGNAKVAGTNFDFVATWDATTTIAAGDWFLASNKLYKSTGATTIAGTRAYLKAKTATARVVKVVFDGEDMTTGIANVNVNHNNNEVYDLQGRRVNKAQKGLYITNGKKVVIK